MKISNKIDQTNAERLEAAKTRRSEELKQAKEAKTDSVKADPRNASAKTEISGRAKEMASVKAAAVKSPDVREDKVADLKKKIQDKQYNVSPEQIAGKLLKEHLETSDLE